MVQCAYPNVSMATGFQVIAHQNASSQVHKLYVGQSTADRQAPASVEVEEIGVYLVTVFAIRGGSGIVNVNVEYSELVTIDDVDTPTTPAPTTITTTPAATTKTDFTTPAPPTKTDFTTTFLAASTIAATVTVTTAITTNTSSANSGLHFL